MPGDDNWNWKWRYAQEHRVSDVEEAIELAEKFRQDGTYNWFRGQRSPGRRTLLWPGRTLQAKLRWVGPGRNGAKPPDDDKGVLQ
jgi:hypothetical protein